MVYHRFVVLEMGPTEDDVNTTMSPPGRWSDRMDRKLKEAEAAKVKESKRKEVPLEGWIFGWRRPTPKSFEYIGCCVVLEGAFIDLLVGASTEVTYSEMIRHCDLVIFAKTFDYARNSHQGSTLKDDRGVSFHHAVVPDGPHAGEYYYLDHSRIEWVYKKRAGTP